MRMKLGQTSRHFFVLLASNNSSRTIPKSKNNQNDPKKNRKLRKRISASVSRLKNLMLLIKKWRSGFAAAAQWTKLEAIDGFWSGLHAKNDELRKSKREASTKESVRGWRKVPSFFSIEKTSLFRACSLYKNGGSALPPLIRPRFFVPVLLPLRVRVP